ncbi:MAG: cation diffusion facilitator family transporter [Proteobacteria bacterium]|nr:cation diffusion facilitator family transporter [Pseudomonadota bacterium]
MIFELSNKTKNQKFRVALSSVIAAVFLTSLKLVVGLATNSLGILSEAAHSALDLGAALMTLFAVNISDRPADDSHHYGHGKIEGFSAFIEVLLLLLTCGYIIYEAVHRIFIKHAPIDVNIYAFSVMAISIIIDISRSRALSRVAKRTNSQALEADALHFASDIWSSVVVIVGLIAYKFFNFPLADSLAALAVSILVIVVSIRLAIRTIGVLLDTAPEEKRKQIYELVRNINGVEKIHKLRVRTSGNMLFTDMILLVESNLSIEEAHRISNNVEKKIKEAMPDVDVTVHLEPKESSQLETITTIKKIKAILDDHRAMFDHYHDLDVTCINKKHIISVHIEVDPGTKLKETQAICWHIEQDIKDAIPQSQITIHVEPIKKQ